MKRQAAMLVAMVATMAAFGVSDAQAQVRQGGKFGIGLSGGVGVNGLSLKYFMSDANAVQVTAGLYGLGGGFSVLGLTADYLFELPAIAQLGVLDVGWNLGLGANAVVGDAFRVGVAGVAGLEFLFNPFPIDIVVEYRPTLAVVPQPNLGLVNFSGHARFYF